MTVTPSAKAAPGKKFYALTISGWQAQNGAGAYNDNVSPTARVLDDALIDLYYNGSYARLYKDGRLVADNLFCGKAIPWQLAARHFAGGEYELEIQELKESEKIYLEDRPDFTDGSACAFVRAEVTPLYKTEF